jgi:hypothetical protein
MIDVPVLDELLEIKLRLTDTCEGDFERYEKMLRETRIPAGMPTRSVPLFPEPTEFPKKASA